MRVDRVDWIGEIQSNSIHIFRRILGLDLRINKLIHSPLREDKNPSFCIYLNRDKNILMYKDYATGEGGDVIKLYSQLKGLTYKQAVRALKKDIDPCWEADVYKYTPKREAAKIGVKRKKWLKQDLKYWGQYGISQETLDRYQVAPIAEYIVGDKCRFRYTKECPMYVYKIFNSLKIYRPMSQKRIDKWRTTCSAYDIQGWEQLRFVKNEILIITKSLKDVMALSEMGYNAIAPSSENTQMPDEVIAAIKQLTNKVYILFDNDEAGIKASEKLWKKCPSWNRIFMGGEKDISDYISKNGIEKAKEWLTYILK